MILVFTDITISEESSIEWTGGVWSTSLDPIPTDGKTEQVSLVQNQNYFMTSTASICRWKRVAETCAVTSSMTIPSWRMRKRISRRPDMAQHPVPRGYQSCCKSVHQKLCIKSSNSLTL